LASIFRCKPVTVAAIMLLVAVAPLIWLYVGGIDRTLIYWLLVIYPTIACVTGIVSFGMLMWIWSRAVVIQYGRIAVGILLMAWLISAYGWWSGIWGAPDHNDTAQLDNHVYYVAVNPLYDVGNFYYLYECDSVGLLCAEVWSGSSYTPDLPVHLTVDENRHIINIMQDTRLMSTYEPPD
jgi:hypothetical protein